MFKIYAVHNLLEDRGITFTHVDFVVVRPFLIIEILH